MDLFSIREKQCFPISIEEAWAFFSNPANLGRITPPYLNFEITSDVPEKIYAGMLVTYRIRPILGVAVTWITEITYMAEPHFFTDEQRFGPYRFWHHQHFFREMKGGVEVQDVVHYALSAGPFSKLANALVVRKRLEEIFQYRRDSLEEMFGRLDCNS
jgi:ligand-binding SRPBCC domain-containing protein